MEPNQERVVTIAYHVRWNPVLHNSTITRFTVFYGSYHGYGEGDFVSINGLVLCAYLKVYIYMYVPLFVLISPPDY